MQSPGWRFMGWEAVEDKPADWERRDLLEIWILA
jgi:hypothetical protein